MAKISTSTGWKLHFDPINNNPETFKAIEDNLRNVTKIEFKGGSGRGNHGPGKAYTAYPSSLEERDRVIAALYHKDTGISHLLAPMDPANLHQNVKFTDKISGRFTTGYNFISEITGEIDWSKHALGAQEGKHSIIRLRETGEVNYFIKDSWNSPWPSKPRGFVSMRVSHDEIAEDIKMLQKNHPAVYELMVGKTGYKSPYPLHLPGIAANSPVINLPVPTANRPITTNINDFPRFKELTQAIVDSPFDSSNAKSTLQNLGRRQKLNFVHQDKYSALKNHILASVGFDLNEPQTPAMQSAMKTIDEVRESVLSERESIKANLPINKKPQPILKVGETTEAINKTVESRGKVFGYMRNDAGEIVPLNPYPPEPAGVPFKYGSGTYQGPSPEGISVKESPKNFAAYAKARSQELKDELSAAISSDPVVYKGSKTSSGLTGALSDVAAATSSSTKEKIAEDTLRAVEVVQSKKLGYAAVAAGAGALVLGMRNRRKSREEL
jgi:hypothetical protein